VDLAAPMGGNCELTQPGKTATVNGVTIVGHTNLPSTMAVHASQLYSSNMEKLLLHLAKDGSVRLDPQDEIARGCWIIREGAVIHPKVKELLS